MAVCGWGFLMDVSPGKLPFWVRGAVVIETALTSGLKKMVEIAVGMWYSYGVVVTGDNYVSVF